MKRDCPICYNVEPLKITCRECNGTGIQRVQYETAEVATLGNWTAKRMMQQVDERKWKDKIEKHSDIKWKK